MIILIIIGSTKRKSATSDVTYPKNNIQNGKTETTLTPSQLKEMGLPYHSYLAEEERKPIHGGIIDDIARKYNEPFKNGIVNEDTTDFLVFDFENANRERHSACALGIAIVKNLEIISSKFFLFSPPQNMSFFSEFTDLHGIDWQKVADEPFFDKIFPLIEDDFKNNLLIAYNLPFDKDVLTKTLNYYGDSIPELIGVCALQMSRFYFKGLENYKLSTVCSHLNIKLDHHQAESDALATANIVIHIIKSLKIKKEEKDEKERIKNEKLALKAKKAEINGDVDKAKQLENIKRNIRRNRIKMESFPDDETYKKLHEEYLIKHKEIAGFDYVSSK